jgi:hypothetical protein
MSVTVTNLLAGPGTLYSAPFGSTEPATAQTAIAAPWTDVGGTSGGATLAIKTGWLDLAVDQVLDTPARRLTSRDLSIKTNLAEATLANLALAMNDVAPVTSGTGVTAQATFTPSTGPASFVPTNIAVLLQGQAAPLAGQASVKNRRVIARSVHNTAGTGFDMKKDGQTLLGVEFHCLFVSASIAPYVVIDDQSTP